MIGVDGATRRLIVAKIVEIIKQGLQKADNGKCQVDKQDYHEVVC